MSSEGFSTLEKKALICYQRAMLPIQSGVTALSNNNGALKGHFYLQRAVTPNQITQQNSLQRAGVPQRAEKAL